eukprot:XP_001704989.1 Hypothetical protein GL50803_36433 [Giardia lamblia ATCC 50803]
MPFTSPKAVLFILFLQIPELIFMYHPFSFLLFALFLFHLLLHKIVKCLPFHCLHSCV